MQQVLEYRGNGKENGNYYNGLYRGSIGIYIGSILKRLSSLLPRPYLFPRSPPFGEIALLDIGQREGKVLGQRADGCFGLGLGVKVR